MTPAAIAYASHRPRGFAPWNPQRATRELLEQVAAILEEYRVHLPLTCRQLFYRLVGAHGYAKDEAAYERLLDKVNRGRRAGLIPWGAIRDDGMTADSPNGFCGVPDFWAVVVATAESYRRDRQEGQPARLELWVEAAGMVPQASRIAHAYGIPVCSSGGFDSVTAKHAARGRVLDRGETPTIVLHVGDHDPSGLSVFTSAAEDVRQMVADSDGDPDLVRFDRVAVTPAQIAAHALPEAPAKATDRRGTWTGGTVQAEALPPSVLADEIRQAIEERIDSDVYAEILATEARERAELRERMDRMQ